MLEVNVCIVFLLILTPKVIKSALFLFASFLKYCFCPVVNRQAYDIPRRQVSVFTDGTWKLPNDVSVSVFFSAKEARIVAHTSKAVLDMWETPSPKSN